MLQERPIGPGAGSTVIAAMPASVRQQRIAFCAFIVLVIIATVNMPLAHSELGRIHSFVPVVQGAMCTTNFLTAVLLFAQYSIYPQRALLALAAGFVFSGLFALLHALAFPSAHNLTVLMGDKLNSPSWLSVFWHISLPLAVIVYALSKDGGKPGNRSGLSIGLNVGITLACAIMATAALTWIATIGVGYLPSLHQSEIYRTPFAMEMSIFLTLLTATALGILFVRRYTLLDQWLMVTLVAWLPALIMGSFINDLRFSEVWYLNWLYALLAGSSLLFVMLIETLLFYGRSDQYQRLLIAELDHRVKNVLAQVAAVTASTREGSFSIREFFRSLDGRIQSMATAHTLLSERGWQNVGLEALVCNQLAPYATGANVTINGAKVILNSAETQAIARVLHELGTNAAKYGALSTPGGHVAVTWDCEMNGQAAKLVLLWRELGGPPVAPERRSGYGTDLICNMIPHELGGAVDLVFAAEGVNCRIEIPMRQA